MFLCLLSAYVYFLISINSGDLQQNNQAVPDTRGIPRPSSLAAVLLYPVQRNDQWGICNSKYPYPIRDPATDFLEFGKLIVKGIVHGDTLKTVLYSFPSGGFLTFFILSGTFLSSKIKNSRTIIMVVYLIPTIVGTILIWKLPRTELQGLLISYYIVSSDLPDQTSAPMMPTDNPTDDCVCGLFGHFHPDGRQQCSRLHEAINIDMLHLPGLLCRQHHWTACLHWLRGADLPVWMQNDHRMCRWSNAVRCAPACAADLEE